MKIDRIEVIHLKYDYPGRRGFRYAGGVCQGRLTTLVLVHTNDGHVGHGSAYTHPALAEIVIKQQLEPFLIGEDPCEVENLWDQMYRLTRWYGRKGAVMTALGALDTAFWDLRGQSKGKPVYSLLGGKRTTCPAYASALLWREPSELAEEAAGYVARGFRRMKMRMGRSPDVDRACVLAVRKAIGPDCDFMVDGSMRYSEEGARQFGKFLAEQKVFWFEEPFPPEQIDSFRKLRGTIGVRLAAGENEFGVQGFREWIEGRVIDIAQPDVSRSGGVTETWRIGQLAARHDIPIATHSWSDAVAVVANAHVVSALPNGLTVEIDQTGNPMVEELLAEPFKVVDGEIRLSDKPGFGIELVQSVVDRLRINAFTQLENGLYSDMAFGKGSFTPAPAYVDAT